MRFSYKTFQVPLVIDLISYSFLNHKRCFSNEIAVGPIPLIKPFNQNKQSTISVNITKINFQC